MNQNEQHENFMDKAIMLAQKAALLKEVPVGALIVYKNQIVGEGYNLREQKNDPLAHAEILAIREASKNLNRWRLFDCTIYITLEPCVMCAGAIIQARINTVVFGALDQKYGAIASKYNMGQDQKLNHSFQVIPHIKSQECSQILSSFFKELRSKF